MLSSVVVLAVVEAALKAVKAGTSVVNVTNFCKLFLRFMVQTLFNPISLLEIIKKKQVIDGILGLISNLR